MTWNELSIAQRSQIMNIMRANGVYDLHEMQRIYDANSVEYDVQLPKYGNPYANVYASGGPLSYHDYISRLPETQHNAPSSYGDDDPLDTVYKEVFKRKGPAPEREYEKVREYTRKEHPAEESKSEVKDTKYNIFKDPEAFAARDAHLRSLDAFIKKNPTVAGLNTAQFRDLLSAFSGLEGSYNSLAGKGMKYSGYYGLENGRNYSPDAQHRMAYEHLAKLFKHNITKDDLQKGIEKGYTPAQVLYKYWNQQNHATEFLQNGIDHTEGNNPPLGILGNQIEVDIDYADLIPEANKNPYQVVKKGDTFSTMQERSRYPGRHYDVAGKDLAAYNPQRMIDGKLSIGDTLWFGPKDTLMKNEGFVTDVEDDYVPKFQERNQILTIKNNPQYEGGGKLFYPYPGMYADGGKAVMSKDDYYRSQGIEPEYYDKLNASGVTASLPSINTPQGKKLASKMASNISVGKMNSQNVPSKYRTYIEGELKGAIPTTSGISDAGKTIGGQAARLGLGLAFGPAGLLGDIAASGIDNAVYKISEGKYQNWGDMLVNPEEHPYLNLAAQFTNPGWYVGGIANTPGKVRELKNAFRLSPEISADVSGLNTFLSPFTYTPKPIKAAAQKAKTPAYQIENLGGGYMLNSLLRGSKLEKQIGKNGQISVQNVRSAMKNGSKMEQAVTDKVLSSEEFAGQKSVDYNKLRKAVQEELITYNRRQSSLFEDYGIDRLGFKEPTLGRPAFERFLNEHPEINGFVDTDGLGIVVRTEQGARLLGPRELEREYPNWQNLPETNTFTFSSPRIPQGSDKHFTRNTLGHSRTYTTSNEPDVLHVMESQSDWAQAGKHKQIQREFLNNEEQKKYISDYIFAHPSPYDWAYINNDGTIFSSVLDQGLTKRLEESYPGITEWVNSHGKLLGEGDTAYSSMVENLGNNYTSRQIQENLKYAAEKGQKKMRYPTRETAAKIEGYPEREAYFDAEGKDVTKEQVYVRNEATEKRLAEIEKEQAEITDRQLSLEDSPTDAQRYEDLVAEARRLKLEEPHLKPGITKKTVYDYEDILRKYTEFPNQYKKLFKGSEVRTVTDPKNNTWYEVDVPENYLQQEWKYRSGGLLNSFMTGGDIDRLFYPYPGMYGKGGKIHIKPSKRGTFTAAAKKHGKSVAAFAAQVLANPENYSPAMRKKANFARNARRWKRLGGPLKEAF